MKTNKDKTTLTGWSKYLNKLSIVPTIKVNSKQINKSEKTEMTKIE